MKHIFFLCSILLCFIQVNAQLKVDAGNDVIVCSPNDPLEARSQLSGMASGGVEPYSYTWSGKIPIYYSEDSIKWIKASEFLDDTTKSSPTFRSLDAPDDWVTFYLKVEDASGNVQSDSVKIIRSVFLVKMILKRPIAINNGDSVQFFGDIYFESNFLPLEYSFIPTTGLTDPHDIYGWAKPDTSTIYYLQAVNSAGCVAKVEYWRINVDTTTASNNDIANRSAQCYLRQGDLIIQLPAKNHSPYHLNITTANGSIIHSAKYTNRNLRLSNLDLKENQLYVVSINDGNERMVFKLIGN